MDHPVVLTIPDSINRTLNRLNPVIGPIYLVGGTLRDCLLNRPFSPETDLLTPMALAQCKRRLREAGFDNVKTGKNNKNILLLPVKSGDAIATLKISTLRHRVGQKPSVEEDLLHRDITVNAMAYQWPHGPLIDPYGGKRDLDQKIARLVNGAATLEGDPLRALRFFRLVLKLGATPIPDHLTMAESASPARLSPEKVRAELDRLFSLPLDSETDHQLFRRLFVSRLGSELLPELAKLKGLDGGPNHAETVWDHAIDAALAMSSPQEEREVQLLDLRWAALILNLGKKECCVTEKDGRNASFPQYIQASVKAGRSLLDRLRFSNRRRNKILAIIQNYHMAMPPTDRVLKRLIKQGMPVVGALRLIGAGFAANRSLTPEQHALQEQRVQKGLERALHLRFAESNLSIADLALSGGEIHDLVRLRPGPWMSQLQRDLIAWVQENPARNRPDPLKDRVRRWVAEHPDFD